MPRGGPRHLRGDYPLTRQRFLTDGETIFHEVLETEDLENEPGLLDLRRRQHVFRSIIKDSLYAGIEYDGEEARRWFPEGKNYPVVVDANGRPLRRLAG